MLFQYDGMDVPIIRKKTNPYITSISIPISEKMKRKLQTLKDEYDVDINQMAREFFEQLIAKLDDKLNLD